MQNNTKDRIIRTAIEMFSSSGYSQSTMRELASRVGINPASLYYHYPSKAALLDEILEMFMERDRRTRVPAETLIEAVRTLPVREVLPMMFLKYQDDEDLYTSLHILRIAVGYQYEYPKAKEVFDYIFYTVGLEYRERVFQGMVAAGLVEPFDCASAAYAMTAFSMMRMIESMNRELQLQEYSQAYHSTMSRITAFIAPLIRKVSQATEAGAAG